MHPCLLWLITKLPCTDVITRKVGYIILSHFEGEWKSNGQWNKLFNDTLKTLEVTILVCGEACINPQLDVNNALIASNSPQTANLQARVDYFIGTQAGPRQLEGCPIIELLTAASSFLFKLLPILDISNNINLFQIVYVILTLFQEPTKSTSDLIFYLLTATVFFASTKTGTINVCSSNPIPTHSFSFCFFFILSQTKSVLIISFIMHHYL